MNHLRELIEARVFGGLAIARDIDVRSERLMISMFDECVEDAICFDMGDAGAMGELTIIDELVRLPYPTTWFEGLVSDGERRGVAGCLAVAGDGDELARFTGTLFTRIERQWLMQGSYFVAPPMDRDGSEEPHAYKLRFLPGDRGNDLRVLTRCFHGFLSALHCANVCRREIPADQALNRARASRGKRPLFSSWILELSFDKAEPNGLSRGGTHNSPRLHLRRGHPRQFAPGRWTWVQPHTVGNKHLGMVHKDYAVVGK